ncbi:hypothetical protein LBMAG42_00990 [Deltaproteobacteria bacterium]|nr:hypothetical protein LBMAG42_00990 [Deltaproteobacteria bacterium]
MLHLIAWAAPGTLLFRTWAEGVACLEVFAAAFPDLDALLVMPDHVHIKGDWPKAEVRLARAETAFARRRFAMRGKEGPRGAFARHPEPTRIVNKDHERRTRRYIYLNPVRDEIVECPLAWPLSTYRDRLGLAAFPLVPKANDPERLHRYVSTDADSQLGGTPFPQLRARESSIDDVIDAVSAITRVGPEALTRGGRARTLAVETAWMAGIRDTGLLAKVFQLSPRAVRTAVSELPDSVYDPVPAAVEACLRVLGDPRFERLDAGGLLRRADWAKLRHLR